MKALFGIKQRNYPDHHSADFIHPHQQEQHSQRSNVSQLADAQSSERSRRNEYAPAKHQGNVSADRARSTLDALQMIRRRFEETQKQQLDDQAA